jgi:hypothetical protein
MRAALFSHTPEFNSEFGLYKPVHFFLSTSTIPQNIKEQVNVWEDKENPLLKIILMPATMLKTIVTLINNQSFFLIQRGTNLG